MYDLMLYSLKTGVCLAVFYLFFKLLLSRETFHRLNRIVVLGTVVLSFVLPLCVVTVYRELPVQPQPVAGEMMMTAAAEAPETEFPWRTFAGAVFVLGAVAALAWTCRSVLGVLWVIRSGRQERQDDGTVLVCTPKAVTPFSWGRYIVLSEEDRAESGCEIIVHERAHVRLHHSWDLMLTDAAGCLQWFNPAMWLLRRELRAIHEYEADKAVLDSGADARQYQVLLIKKAAGGRWYSVANSFNHSKLKNRITMMLRKRSSRWAAAKVLFVLPLTALALGAFARTAYVFPEDNGKKEKVEIHISGPDFSVVGNDFTFSGEKSLILLDGREVGSMDSLRSDQIASISVVKDSSMVVKYGEKAREGVIFVTSKSAAGERKEVMISTFTTVSGNEYSQRSKVDTLVSIPNTEGGPVLVHISTKDVAGPQFSKTHVTYERPGDQNWRYEVDGREVKDINSVNPAQIESVMVLKSDDMENYKDLGYDRVVRITTKQAAALQKTSLAEAAEEGVKGIEAARKGLEYARKYMDAETWTQTRKALAQALADLDKTAGEQPSLEAGAAARIEGLQGKIGDIVVTGYSAEKKSENTKTKPLYIIDGKKVSDKEFEKLSPGNIDRIYVLKDKTAVEKYGRKGRNGVVEIYTKETK